VNVVNECIEGHRLCKPHLIPRPSGLRFCHSWSCPDQPGEPIDVKTYAKGRRWPRLKGEPR
jgi:hypothetical protein